MYHSLSCLSARIYTCITFKWYNRYFVCLEHFYAPTGHGRATSIKQCFCPYDVRRKCNSYTTGGNLMKFCAWRQEFAVTCSVQKLCPLSLSVGAFCDKLQFKNLVMWPGEFKWSHSWSVNIFVTQAEMTTLYEWSYMYKPVRKCYWNKYSNFITSFRHCLLFTCT